GDSRTSGAGAESAHRTPLYRGIAGGDAGVASTGEQEPPDAEGFERGVVHPAERFSLPDAQRPQLLPAEAVSAADYVANQPVGDAAGVGLTGAGNLVHSANGP